MPKNETKTKTESIQIVGFNIDDKEYAVDIKRIMEIIHYKDAVSLPNSPDFIRGVIDLRGTVIPVLDLKKRLALRCQSTKPPRHMLILRLKDKAVGMVVDQVNQVYRIDENMIQAPQKLLKSADTTFLRGVYRSEEGLVFILSVDTLLSADEQAQLEEI